jgi:hypothetical protein
VDHAYDDWNNACLPCTTIIHPQQQQQTRSPRIFFSRLSLGRTGVQYGSPRAHFIRIGTLAEQSIIGSNWFKFPHSGTSLSAFGRCRLYPPNPNVVWRRALSIMLSLRPSEPPSPGQSSFSMCQVSQMSGSLSLSRCAVAHWKRDDPQVTGRLSRRLIRNNSSFFETSDTARPTQSPDIHFPSVMNEICSPPASTLLDRYYNL